MSDIQMEHGAYWARFVLTPHAPGNWEIALVYDCDGSTRVWMPMGTLQTQDAEDLICYEFSKRLPSAHEIANCVVSSAPKGTSG